jgi:transposase
VSTSLLYHGFGIRGYRYVRTDYVTGEVVFRIEQDIATCHCSACDSAHVAPRGEVDRPFRSLPIGGKPVKVRLAIPRVACQDCGVIRQTPIAFADPRRTYTKAFERYALELSQYMTILDVARHLGTSWDVIKDIQKRHLQQRFAKSKLKHIRQIAIDEISYAKGHRYLTIVLDLESGAVVHVGDGKGGDALKPFWRQLRGSGAKIEAVAIDMSPAYIDAVTRHLPRATVVFDRLHVMKLYNDKLSDLRRELHQEASEKMHKAVLKGTRWLLLKRPEHLDETRHERARLAIFRVTDANEHARPGALLVSHRNFSSNKYRSR